MRRGSRRLFPGYVMPCFLLLLGGLTYLSNTTKHPKPRDRAFTDGVLRVKNNRIKNSKQQKNASEKPSNSNSNGRKWPATNAVHQPFPAPTQFSQATLLPPAPPPPPLTPMTRTKRKRINPSSRSSLLSSNIPYISRGKEERG